MSQMTCLGNHGVRVLGCHRQPLRRPWRRQDNGAHMQAQRWGCAVLEMRCQQWLHLHLQRPMSRQRRPADHEEGGAAAPLVVSKQLAGIQALAVRRRVL